MPEILAQKAGISGVPLHKGSHEPGGDDPLTSLTDAAFATANKDGAAGVPSLRTLGTGAAQALPGDHASTTNARTPIAHQATHQPGADDAILNLTDASIAAANIDGVAGTASMRTIGAGAQQAAAGDHLHDSRYIRTVNGTGPDSGGNVVVAGGGGGTEGVGSIMGVSPNAPGGNINLSSAQDTAVFTADNVADTVIIDIPKVADAAGTLLQAETNITSNAANLAAHIANAAGAHAASAISVLDTANNYAGVTVEAILAELADWLVPVGVILPYGGTTASIPTGYIGALGQQIAQASYPVLFSRFGTTYNSGTESPGFFRLPNGQTRALIGAGSFAGNTTRALGAVVGAEDHLLTANQSGVQAHTHAYLAPDPAESTRQSGGSAAIVGRGSIQSGSTSATAVTAHNNMQPSIAVNFIVKVG